MPERQLTSLPSGHVLTNTGVWSADSRWIVYDVRSGPDGSVFDGTRIERVEVDTGRVEVLHQSRHGACCGVVTASPGDDRVVFILGPEQPSAEWRYGPARRQGAVVRASRPGVIEPLDARDLVAPFTPGALRGGSHVHVFSPDGRLVSFTYEDAVLESCGQSHASPAVEKNLRGIGVSVCDRPVRVPRTHPRNHDGTAFTVLVTRLSDAPRPGSDEISTAFEEAWIGTHGYLRTDGTRQRYALAFQGGVAAASGGLVREVFVCDLPDEPDALMEPGADPLAGTPTTRPAPPRGVVQRRITFMASAAHAGLRRHPGIAGPRHWLRSSPDGARIAFLARHDDGVVRLFTVSPAAGAPVAVTRDSWDVESAFSWSPDGRRIACVGDGSVQLIDVADGTARRLTAPGASPLRPEACVFAPDGRRIAVVRSVGGTGVDRRAWNQICVVDVPE
jgi:hypothetical protein